MITLRSIPKLAAREKTGARELGAKMTEALSCPVAFTETPFVLNTETGIWVAQIFFFFFWFFKKLKEMN